MCLVLNTQKKHKRHTNTHKQKNAYNLNYNLNYNLHYIPLRLLCFALLLSLALLTILYTREQTKRAPLYLL